MSDESVAERFSRPSTRGSLAGASEREERNMTVPNAGPHHHDPSEQDGSDVRRANPALLHHDEPPTTAPRSTAASHRFAGTRHPLIRTDRFPQAEHHPNDGGDPDASH